MCQALPLLLLLLAMLLGVPGPYKVCQAAMSIEIGQLTNLDKAEKVAQAFYAGACIFAPAWWLSDTYLDSKAASNPTTISIVTMLGVLVATIGVMSATAPGLTPDHLLALL